MYGVAIKLGRAARAGTHCATSLVLRLNAKIIRDIIFVVLFSSSFIESDFCRPQELWRRNSQHQQKQLRNSVSSLI